MLWQTLTLDLSTCSFQHSVRLFFKENENRHFQWQTQFQWDKVSCHCFWSFLLWYLRLNFFFFFFLHRSYSTFIRLWTVTKLILRCLSWWFAIIGSHFYNSFTSIDSHRSNKHHQTRSIFLIHCKIFCKIILIAWIARILLSTLLSFFFSPSNFVQC